MTSYRRPFLTCPVHLCSLLSYQMPTLTLHSSYSKLLAVPRMCLTYSCHWTFTSASGFPGGVSDKALACQRRRCKRRWFDPWVGRILWKRAWQHTPVFLPGESHGQRSLADYSPWGHKGSNMTEQLSNNTCQCGEKKKGARNSLEW